MISTRRSNDKLIKRTLEHIVATSNADINLYSELEERYRSNTRVKILWILFIMLCVLTCVIQVGERISYYFTYPTHISTSVDEKQKGNLPKITVCTDFTDKYDNLSAKFKIPNYPNISSKDYWEMIDTTTTIKEAYITKKNVFLTNASVERFVHIRGTCADIFNAEPLPISDPSLKMRVIFNKKLALVYIFLRNKDDKLLDSMSLDRAGMLNSLTKIYFREEKIKYVNTKKNPCKEPRDYDKCKVDSEQKLYAERFLDCKFPFMTTKISMQFCSMPTHRNFFFALQIELDNLPARRCYRSCERGLTRVRFEEFDDKREEFELSLDSHLVHTLQQEPSYDIISLLCDIGGNISLYLGLSCLSLIELIIQCTEYTIRKKRTSKMSSSYLYLKVSEIYRKYSLRSKHCREDAGISIGIVNRILMLIRFCAVCVAMYQTTQSITYYFTYPTSTTVDVTEFVKMPPPNSIISCMESEKIQELKLQYAERFNASYDDVDLLDLMKSSPNSSDIESLWAESSRLDKHEFPHLVRNIFLSSGGFIKPYVTYFGNCTEMHPGILSYRMISNNCWYKVFIIQFNETINLKHFLILRCNWWYEFKYSQKQIIRPNAPNNPCSTTEESLTCEQSCYQSILMSKNISCRMPFMEWSDLPMCNSFDSAKRTREEYLKTYLNTNPISECSCKIRCSEILQPTDLVYYFPKPKPWYSCVSLMLQETALEVITHVLTFSAIKMLCDIGSNLGSILGISILSSFAFVTKTLRVIRNVKTKVFK